MRHLNFDTLIEIRDRLKICLELMHDEANTCAKMELIRVIAELDRMLELGDQQPRREDVIRLIGKIVDKLPWLLSVIRFFE